VTHFNDQKGFDGIGWADFADHAGDKQAARRWATVRAAAAIAQ
jgi:hypothetical protein